MRAAIDVGSNTVRMLLGSVAADGTLVPLHYFRRVTRLGGGGSPDKGLSFEAMEQTLFALREFSEELVAAEVDRVVGVGTAALRQARNGAAFISRIRQETGLDVAIIDGITEARLTAAGVLAALEPKPCNALIFDIGGGSTEFILVEDGVPRLHRSYPLGVVALCDGSLNPGDQLTQIDLCLDALFRDLEATGNLSQVLDDRSLLVGTAGTVTTLAAMQLGMTDYDWRRVNNLILTQNDLQYWAQHLAQLDIAGRERLPGLEKGRGDLILPGVAIVQQLLRRFCKERLTISDFGLLEGLLLTPIENAQGLD